MYIANPAQSITTAIVSPLTMDLQSVLAPLHLLSFSTLLGAQLYQTFIVTKICYISLPRSAFTTLQKRLFPIYFRCQSLLLLLTMITIPSQGPLTLVANKAAWIPFAIAGTTAALNLLVYGPRTRQIMIERIHQGGPGFSLVSTSCLFWESITAVVRTCTDTVILGYRNTRWIAETNDRRCHRNS